MENTNVTINVSGVRGGQSYFDGSLLGLIANRFLMILVVVFTLGLGTPWALCRAFKYEINHTVVEGHRLRFIGHGGDLFGQYIKCMLLSLITFGIYSFWLSIKLQEWKVKHTVFAC